MFFEECQSCDVEIYWNIVHSVFLLQSYLFLYILYYYSFFFFFGLEPFWCICFHMVLVVGALCHAFSFCYSKIWYLDCKPYLRLNFVFLCSMICSIRFVLYAIFSHSTLYRWNPSWNWTIHHVWSITSCWCSCMCGYIWTCSANNRQAINFEQVLGQYVWRLFTSFLY